MELTLQLFFIQIGEEVRRIVAREKGLPLDRAYDQAITVVTMRTVEEMNLSPIQAKVLGIMRDHCGQNGLRQGIKRGDIHKTIQLEGMHISEWSLSQTLSLMEKERLVYRLARRGKVWFPAPVNESG